MRTRFTKIAGATGIVITSLVIISCTPASDDMMALGSTSESTAGTLTSVGSEAEVTQEIGRDRPWTLLLLPSAATAEDIRKTGVSEELVEKLSARSATWHGQDCLAYFDPGRLAYSEWPQRAGDIRAPIAISGTTRRTVKLRIVRGIAGVAVLNARTIEP